MAHGGCDGFETQESQQLRSNKDTPSPPQAEGVKGEKGK